MATRTTFALALLGFLALATPAAQGAPSRSARSHRTTNFEVFAASARLARQIGKSAERHRKEVARRWLRRELLAWRTRCPISVTITLGGCSGSTTFRFDGGQVVSHEMQVRGSLEQVQGDVLAHEVTHLIFAHHFGQAMPRWADEGGAVCAEGAATRGRHDATARQMVLRNTKRLLPLRRLFALKDYPRDVLAFYAQSQSVARFLIEAKGHRTFLAFVETGMQGGWSKGLRRHYGYKDVAELERAWMKKVREKGLTLARGRSVGKERPESRKLPRAPAVSAGLP
jgi:hypothetical protein